MERNRVPVTVSANAALPTVPLEGEIEVIAGTGLFTGKSTPNEVPPPGDGLTTVNIAIVAVAKLLAGMVAPKFVAEL